MRSSVSKTSSIVMILALVLGILFPFSIATEDTLAADTTGHIYEQPDGVKVTFDLNPINWGDAAPVPTIKINGYTLKKDVDYYGIFYNFGGNSFDANYRTYNMYGTCRIYVGMNIDSQYYHKFNHVVGDFYVKQITLSSCNITTPTLDYLEMDHLDWYTKIRIGDYELPSKDYTISFPDQLKAGTNKFKFALKNTDHPAIKAGTINYTMKAVTLNDDTFYPWRADDQLYTGKPIYPITGGNIYIGGKCYPGDGEGIDLKITYSDNVTDVGTVTLTVTGGPVVEGTVTKTFKILPRPLSDCEYTLDNRFIADGTKKNPNLKVTFDGKTLKKGTDYKFTVGTLIEPGEYPYTIEGIGNFTGEIKGTINIGESSSDWDDLIFIDETNFPDPGFREVVAEADPNNDGALSREEIKTIERLVASNKGIKNLKGLEIFTSLKQFFCSKNELTSLDVSKNIYLTHLSCSSNKLTNIDISNNKYLDQFHCYGNPDLKEINISNNVRLKTCYQYGKTSESNYDTGERSITYEYSDWDLEVSDTVKITLATPTPTVTPTPTKAPATATPKPTATTTPKATVTAKPTAAVSTKPTTTPKVTKAPGATATPKVTTKPDVSPSVTAAPTDAPVTPDDPKAQILAFVERIYTYVLDREPEADGAAFWSDELYAFRRTGAEVAQGFIFSPEFEGRKTSDEQFVTILYKTFFGRDPEEGGMKYWLSQLSSGAMDRVTVANGFIYSQEWADTCASYGIRSGGDLKPAGAIAPTSLTYAFVERMYTTCMGRGYDEEGRQYWASLLANFETTGEIVGASFFLSDEMTSYGLSDQEFLNRLYLTFMDRESDADGAAYWLGLMASGTPRADVVFGFTRSPEFTDKCVEARILPY